jgi:hypothetical protein
MERRERSGSSARPAGRVWLAAVLVLVVLATLGLAGRGDAATAYDPEERQFLALINDYREQNGLRPVILSDTLTVAAEHHSLDMAEYGFFAHNTERSSYYPAGSEPWDRMEAEGYDYNTFKGENLAVGYETAEEALRAWKESPSHNAAMLDGNYRVMGVARLNSPGSDHGWYWTTDFGGHVDPSAQAPGETPGDQQLPKPEAAPDVPQEPPATDPDRATVAPATDTGALDDGRMRGTGVWEQEARDAADLILEEDYARLGGYHLGRDVLRQEIRPGANAELVYDVKIKGGSVDPEDTMIVRLTDEAGRQITVLDRYSGEGGSGWERERADLSRFAGRTVFLSFHAKTDGDRLTTFYLDDLTLRQ